MPWVEDQYLSWFGKDNKASYATKGIPQFHSPWFVPSAYMEKKSLRSFSSQNTPIRTDNQSPHSSEQLSKTKVTGIPQVDKVQDDVNNLAAGQLGRGGLGEGAGNMMSKEGINRAERGGKDNKGRTAPGPLGNATDPFTENAKAGAGKLGEAGKQAGGYVGGVLGAGRGDKETK